MFLARESLFLRGGDNPAVPQQARRAVVIKRGNTEDVDCALAGPALCIRGWIHRAKSFIAYLTIRLPLRQLIFQPIGLCCKGAFKNGAGTASSPHFVTASCFAGTSRPRRRPRSRPR